MLQTIRAKKIECLRNKKKQEALLLSSVLGEVENAMKNGKQDESTVVVNTIKKFIKNAEDNAKSCPERKAEYEFEMQFLGGFLPQQLTEQEIKSLIRVIIDLNTDKSAKAVGVVMKELNKDHAGKFDTRLAAQIIKELLGL